MNLDGTPSLDDGRLPLHPRLVAEGFSRPRSGPSKDTRLVWRYKVVNFSQSRSELFAIRCHGVGSCLASLWVFSGQGGHGLRLSVD